MHLLDLLHHKSRATSGHSSGSEVKKRPGCCICEPSTLGADAFFRALPGRPGVEREFSELSVVKSSLPSRALAQFHPQRLFDMNTLPERSRQKQPQQPQPPQPPQPPPKRRRIADVVRDVALLSGLFIFWILVGLVFPPVILTAEDVCLWPYSVDILVKLVTFLGSLYWPSAGGDLGPGEIFLC